MKYVGNELQRLALNEPETTNADLLGRSAFNRYYYAAFFGYSRDLRLFKQRMEGYTSWQYSSTARNELKEKG